MAQNTSSTVDINWRNTDNNWTNTTCTHYWEHALLCIHYRIIDLIAQNTTFYQPSAMPRSCHRWPQKPAILCTVITGKVHRIKQNISGIVVHYIFIHFLAHLNFKWNDLPSCYRPISVGANEWHSTYLGHVEKKCAGLPVGANGGFRFKGEWHSDLVKSKMAPAKIFIFLHQKC